MNIIQLSNTKLDPQVFFDRAINPIAWPKLAVIGDLRGDASALNLTNGVLTAINCHVDLYTVSSDRVNQMPEEVRSELRVIDQMSPAATQDAIESINSSNQAILIDPSIQLSSSVEILLEKIITRATGAITVTGQAVKLTQYKDLARPNNMTAIIDTVTLIKLLNTMKVTVNTNQSRGIYQVADFAVALATKLKNTNIIVRDNDAIYYYIERTQNFYILLNCTSVLSHQGLVEALIFGLSTPANNDEKQIHIALQFIAELTKQSYLTQQEVISAVRNLYGMYC